MHNQILVPPPLALRTLWFLYLSRHRKLLANTPAWNNTGPAAHQCTPTRKRARTESTYSIPLLIQVIQAIASIAALNPVIAVPQQTPVLVENRSDSLDVLPTTCTRPAQLELQRHVDHKRRITELLAENERLRRKYRVDETPRRNNRSELEAVSQLVEEDSPTELVNGANVPRAVTESNGDNGPVDDSHNENLDKTPPFERMSQALPTPQAELKEEDQEGDESPIAEFGGESTIKRLYFESPSKLSPQFVALERDDIQDFEFPGHDDEDEFDAVHEPEVAKQSEVKTEPGAEKRGQEKKHKKKKKHKSKKTKKKKRTREFEDEGAHRHSKRRDATVGPAESAQVAKITPETDRRKTTEKDPEKNAFFDPRVKPYNPALRGVHVLKSGNATVGTSKNGASSGPRIKAFKFTTPNVCTTKIRRLPDQEPPEDKSVNDKSDGLEIPHESPEVPKRTRDEREWEIPHEAPKTVKRNHNREEQRVEVHILCSESFIESSSHVVASLASGSWLADGQNDETTNGVPSHKVITHDTSLLDEIGVDMEIAGKGAIRVQRLSAWGKEQDLKVLIRELVKLSALGRYQKLHMLVCVDIEVTPSLAKDIAFVQSTPLGNTDCIVSFQIVAQRSLAAAIAHKVLRARAQFRFEIDSSIFNSMDTCYGQAAFLLRIVSSLSVGDAIQLLLGKAGSSPCTLRQVLGNAKGSAQSVLQLGLAAHASLDESEV